MDYRMLLGSLFVLCFAWIAECQRQGPPPVSSSYKASGEMVETLEDPSALLTQVAFEESFDSQTKDAAFRICIMGKNVTFVENFATGQTFQHNGETCTLETIEEWIKTKSPPSLLAYEDTNGTVRFSLKQLFSLDKKYLKEYNVSDTFRGIAARKWAYEIQGREPDDNTRRKLVVYSYWSDRSWNTTSNDDTVPLGFIVTKMTYKRNKPGVLLHEQFINIYAFVNNTVDHKLFEPIQGLVCENRSQTLAFPNVKNMKALALHSELVFPDNLEIRYIDHWIDTQNKIIRMDMERIKDDVPIFEKRNRRFQSETVIGPMGVVFRVTYDSGRFACTVIPFQEFEFDVQNLISFKTPVNKWDLSNILFGKNQTSYVYIGRTVKRDIPCHMFQGVRRDWPDPSSNVTSLWEWCFSVNMTSKNDVVKFRNGEYGLVNAQVKILESDDPGLFYRGLRMIHHFYDVRIQDPAVTNPIRFDIGRCFQETEKRRLQFVVDWAVTDDNFHLVENSTSDSAFLQKWKNVIYQWSELQVHSLRISQVKAVLENKKLYIKYVVLAPHPQLPKEIKDKQKPAFYAENAFRDNLNKGKVFVSYLPSNKSTMLRLTGQKHSLQFQVNRTFVPHTPPPETTITTSARPRFSLITEPDFEKTSNPDPSRASSPDGRKTSDPGSSNPTSPEDSSQSTSSGDGQTTTPNPSPGPQPLKHNYGGHSSATVASVSVAMLLVGVSMGATGIFVRYYGLPGCFKKGS